MAEGPRVNKPPAYQHYARDWLVDTAPLSLEEQGAYQRLLDHEWIEGPMVDNEVELARRISVSVKRFKKVWAGIGRFFVRGEDGKLRNPRLEHERESQEQYRRSQSELGRRGAEKRWHGPGAGERHGGRDSDRHSGANSRGVALQPASTSAFAESQLHGGASRRAGRNEDTSDSEPTFCELMDLVRKHLYVPDGTPPEYWDVARDGSILKVLLKRHGPREVAIAIQGVAIVRDHPGIYADAVDWPDWRTPGGKLTLRALHNSRSGVLPMFTIATQAYWKRENTRGTRKDARSPESLGVVLKRALGGAQGRALDAPDGNDEGPP